MESGLNPMKPVLTVKEAADYLQLSEITILRLASQGIIPGVKLGRQWRFSAEAVANLVRNPELIKAAGTPK